MLTESECLSSHQLGALLVLDLSKTSLTSRFMFFSIHFDVVLGEAASLMILEELAVAAVQNVSFWIGQTGISFCIDSAIFVSDEFCHEGSTMSRVLAVEDEQSLLRRFKVEQLGPKLLLVIEVDSTINVASRVLVLESTVNDNTFLIQVIIVPIQDADHSVFCDSRKVASTIRYEVWQFGYVNSLNVHDAW